MLPVILLYQLNKISSVGRNIPALLIYRIQRGHSGRISYGEAQRGIAKVYFSDIGFRGQTEGGAGGSQTDGDIAVAGSIFILLKQRSKRT